ncbi:MAG: hypothetical protein LUG60_05180 [Erysipelotrichaceae bacterium]|nr:hypothetical protein [Erysipelotrichaceae bacterium]
MKKGKYVFVVCLLFNITYGIYTLIICPYWASSIFDKYLTLWDMGMYAMFFIVTIMLSLIGTVLEKYKEVYYEFDKSCIVRISLKQYMINNIKEIFLKSLFYMMILHGVLFLFNYITCDSSDLIDNANYYYYNTMDYLVSNQILNMILFIGCSCIGGGLLNVFMYSLSIYIKNLYVFMVSPIIVYFISTMMAEIIHIIFDIINIDGLTGILSLGQSIAVGTLNASLLQPGTQAQYRIVGLISSWIIYILIIVINFKYTYRKKQIGG